MPGNKVPQACFARGIQVIDVMTIFPVIFFHAQGVHEGVAIIDLLYGQVVSRAAAEHTTDDDYLGAARENLLGQEMFIMMSKICVFIVQNYPIEHPELPEIGSISLEHYTWNGFGLSWMGLQFFSNYDQDRFLLKALVC